MSEYTSRLSNSLGKSHPSTDSYTDIVDTLHPLQKSLYVYIYICQNTYIRTYGQTDRQRDRQTYMHTYMHPCTHQYHIKPCMHACMHVYLTATLPDCKVCDCSPSGATCSSSGGRGANPQLATSSDISTASE